MATACLGSTPGIFGDAVYSSTNLNRKISEVFNSARRGPVTISRNNEQFALLRREQAASLFKAVVRLSNAVQLLQNAMVLARGGNVPDSFSWMKAFDAADLRQMVDEVLIVIESAMSGKAEWEDVDSLIHEWSESASVVKAGVLKQAMRSEADNEPLPDPRELIADNDTEDALASR